jgi:hypothetical protein
MIDKILEILDDEVEKHKDQENRETQTWDRGFENGAMTEAIRIRIKIRKLMMQEKRADARCLILIL